MNARAAIELRTRSVVDAVEEALRERLLRGEQDGGDQLSELGIATEFGVGRPTAKSAVDRLVADGILIRDGRRGLRVRVLGPGDVGELYESRILLEGHAHRSVAAAGGADLSGAYRHNDRLRAAGARGDHTTVVAEDVALHREMVGLAGNARIDRMHASLMAEAHVCMARVQVHELLDAELIADEHDRILAAVAAGDADGAALESRAHLERARDTLLGRFADAGGSEGPAGSGSAETPAGDR